MAVFETWLQNDLKKPVKVKQLQGNMFSADNGGNLIGVEVMDEGSPASLSGSVYGYVIRADGATVVVEGTLSENKASITLPTSCYVVVGQISIVIKVGTTTVGACTGYVYRTTTDTIVDPGSVVPSLAELLAKIADCEAATTAANNAATNANTKAGLANDAATLANTKAGLANTAAENADNKATLANNAAAKIDNMTATASGLPAGSSPTVSVTEDETDHHKIVAFGIPKGDPGDATIDDTAGIGDNDLVWSADKIQKELHKKADVIEIVDDAAEAIKTIPDGADGLPMALKVGIEPVQAGSGDPSPENVRPISGWTGAKIRRTGKNLLGGIALRDAIKEHIPSATDDGENHIISFGAGATVYSIDGKIINSLYGKLKENTQYTLVITMRNSSKFHTNLAVNYTDSTSKYIQGLSTLDTKQTIVFTTASGKTLESLQKQNGGGQTYIYYDESGIFEGVLTAEDFKAWEGTIYSITFPSEAGTVYGGTLEVYNDGTGKLTVDRQFYSFDGTEGWKLSSGNMVILDNVPSSINTESICSHFATKPVSSMGNILYTSENWIVAAQGLIIDGEAIGKYQAALTKFKNYLAAQYANGTPVQYAVKLEIGTEYPMTASEVNVLLTSLKGLNNIFADTGDILSVEYSADTKIYIDNGNAVQDATASATQEMIADSDLPVATENHSAGEVFICNNQLVRATASIATGDTINTGSGGNAEVVNIVDLITEVVASVVGVATDVNNVKGYIGPDPDAVLTKGAYIQNADQQSVVGRNVGIKDGVITFGNLASTTNYKTVFLTKNLSGINGVTIANVVPSLNNLEPISKLSGITHYRLQVKNNGGTLSEYPFMGFMFCSVDPETDAVTLLGRTQINLESAKKIIGISIPEGTTHYAFFIYQSSHPVCDFTLYPKFMCLYDINE